MTRSQVSPSAHARCGCPGTHRRPSRRRRCPTNRSTTRKIDRKALGAVGGAAIKLSEDADVTMGLAIGEGLETTLAGMGLAPASALGSAGAIARFPVLSGIEALTVLAETGDSGANERAIRACAARWLAAGREIYRATATIGGDMNDAMMSA